MPYRTKTVTVTPELAQKWLEAPSEHQRRISSSYVVKLAEALEAGTFKSSPQPFILDTNGALLDGQHRANAVILSGVPLEQAVLVTGVSPDLFGQLDIGMKRTPAQFIASRRSSLIATAAKWTLLYEKDDQFLDAKRAFTMTPIETVIAEVERRPLLELLSGPVALVSKATHINGPALLAVTVLGSAGASDMVDDWFDGLNTGANLEVGDPRLTLRNTFAASYQVLNTKTGNQRRMMAYIIKSWNAFVQDEQIRVLRFRPNRTGGNAEWRLRSGEAMPRIVGS